jgi:type I restriction enzyme S subunit
MGSEWTYTPLNQVAKLTGGFAFKSKDFIGEGIPVAKIKNVRHRDIDLSDVDYVSEETAKACSKFLIKHGDILISMTGSGMNAPASIVGRVARHSGQNNAFLINQRVGRFSALPDNELDLRYLYYYFSQRDTQLELVSIATGSANQVNLSATQIESLEIPLPPLPEQKAIAHILGSLDEKIELNRKMNATLEAMAQALFNSWFVDFDPVIDNALAAGNPIPEALADRAEVRRQALANGTANREAAKAFPDSFQDTEELGWIPEGWEEQALYDMAKFVNGAAYKGADFSDSSEALPVVKIAEIKAGITAQTKFTEVNKGERYKIDNGDILLSWSGNPDTSIDTFIWTNGPGYLNQHIFNVRLHEESERYFVYYQLKYLRSTFAEIARDKQTTGLGHFTAGDMKRLKVFKPETQLLEHFNFAVSSLYHRSYENRLSTKTLTKLRDTLLPKLISGELRVAEAEQLTKEALV